MNNANREEPQVPSSWDSSSWISLTLAGGTVVAIAQLFAAPLAGPEHWTRSLFPALAFLYVVSYGLFVEARRRGTNPVSVLSAAVPKFVANESPPDAVWVRQKLWLGAEKFGPWPHGAFVFATRLVLTLTLMPMAIVLLAAPPFWIGGLSWTFVTSAALWVQACSAVAFGALVIWWVPKVLRAVLALPAIVGFEALGVLYELVPVRRFQNLLRRLSRPLAKTRRREGFRWAVGGVIGLRPSAYEIVE